MLPVVFCLCTWRLPFLRQYAQKCFLSSFLGSLDNWTLEIIIEWNLKTFGFHDLSISVSRGFTLSPIYYCPCVSMDFSLSLHILPSWFLLIYLRFNAAAVSTDMSFDWLHHGLEDDAMWRGKCKQSNREEVWRGLRDFSLGLGIVLLQYIYTLLYSSQKDRCLLYRLGLQRFYRFFYKFIFAFNTHICTLRELLVALHTGPEEIPSLTTL